MSSNNSNNDSSSPNSNNNGDTSNSNNNGGNSNSGGTTNNISNNDDFKNLTLNETITEAGLIVTNKQGTTVNGNEKTESTFNTTDNTNNAQLNENLVETVIAGYDDSSETGQILSQISTYASKIKCENFHGKGSIDDYNALFAAAATIANDAKQMQLDVDIDGFSNFGAAADNLAALFQSFTQKLQNVSIIDDSAFLNAVLTALIKISNLSDVFGKFKETILLTSTVRIPQSSHNVSTLIQGVMGEVNCAMGYINNFVTVDPTLPAGQLSATDKNIISRAINTIEHWGVLCDQGVSIALANNPDVQIIKQTNTSLKSQASALTAATLALQSKFALLKVQTP